MSETGRKYRVLLADDEPIIIQSLKKAIPWQSLNMEVVAEARDGEEAYRCMAEARPDIVLTDIRMPSMDGLKLMDRIRAERERTVFIVISGYGEFDYAREALRQGAFDYVLKPIDHEELVETIRKAKEKLDLQYMEEERQERLKHSFRMLSAVARERLYLELIEGHYQTPRQLQWLEQDTLDEPYYVMLVRLDMYASLSRKWRQEERRLWQFAVRNILSEYGESERCLLMFPFHSGEWLLVFADEAADQKLPRGRQIVELIKRYTKLSCSIGISAAYQGIGRLGEAYQSAQDGLIQRFYNGYGGVYFAPITDEQQGGGAYPKDLENELIEGAKLVDQRKVELVLAKLKERWRKEGIRQESIQRSMIRLAVVLHRELEQIYSFIEPVEPLIAALHESDTLDAMLTRVAQYVTESISRLRETESRVPSGQVIEKAKRYIEEHYNQDLSVDEAAEVAGLSCSHFCTLFKKETGQTFLEYLTQFRMNKACYLLAHTDVKVYQAAPLVGYQDAKYFTQVFKRMIGMTPSEYRESAAAGAGE